MNLTNIGMLLTAFAASFAMVFLLGLQSRNVSQGRYLAAVITSFGISTANYLFVKFASVGDWTMFAVCAAGGCSGIAAAIWFSQHVIEPRSRLRQRLASVAFGPGQAMHVKLNNDPEKIARHRAEKGLK